MSLVCCTDWRDPARWSYNDKARVADLWSLYWVATETSARSLSGKTLIAFQPAIPIDANGAVSGHPYAQALDALALKYGAKTMLKLYEGPDGGHLQLLDLTARRFAPALALLLHEFHGWADGHHLDYWITPNHFFPPGTFEEDYLIRWQNAQEQLTNVLRAINPNVILIGQNDRMQGGTWSAMNGCYLEQSPYFNGRTLADHSADLDQFSAMQNRYNTGREMVSICEVRQPWQWQPAQLDQVKAWAQAEGLYLSLGRDAGARGA